jgi:phenylalanyl-tRNA synthetase beta chain
MDLEREADLVEEVARHLGYDRVPSTTRGLPTVATGEADPEAARLLRGALAGCGFHEAFGYAMIAAGEDDPFVEPSSPEPLRLTNPIAEGLACLRRSMLPGLVRAVDLNLRRGARDVRLFEVGHVFRARAAGGFPDESERAALAWTGAARPRHWSEPDREVDLLDVSGIVEYLLGALWPEARLRRRPLRLAAFQPGLSVRWETENGAAVAWAGALHPRLAREREIEARIFLAEVDAGRLGRSRRSIPRYVPLPRHTEVARDLSIVLGPRATYESVIEVLSSVPPPTRVDIDALDLYSGPPLEPGRSSLTVRVRLQPVERTLTEDEIEAYRRGLIDALRSRLGVDIRA